MTNYEKAKAAVITLLDLIEQAETKSSVADTWVLEDTITAQIKADFHNDALSVLENTGLLLSIVRSDIERITAEETEAKKDAENAAKAFEKEEVND